MSTVPMTLDQLAADEAVCAEFLAIPRLAHDLEDDVIFAFAARTRWPAALEEIKRLRASEYAARDYAGQCIIDREAATRRADNLEEEVGRLRNALTEAAYVLRREGEDAHADEAMEEVNKR